MSARANAIFLSKFEMDSNESVDDEARPFGIPQVRSASFDEIQLEAAAQRQGGRQPPRAPGAPAPSLLKVPQLDGRRSRSFDSAGSDDSATHLEVPRRFPRRRSSGGKTPPPCVHCYYLDLWRRQRAQGGPLVPPDPVSGTDTTSSGEEDDEDDGFSPPPPSPSPNITVTFSPTFRDFPSPLFEGRPPLCSPTSPGLPVFPPSPTIELPPDEHPPAARRRSISRQEAFFVEPTGSSLENVSGAEGVGSGEVPAEVEVPGVPGLLVRDIYLMVPDLKRDRAASVDSCFSKVPSGGKTEELQAAEGGLLAVPSSGLRSRSVDIVLPTSEQARYKALALAAPAPTPTTPLPPSAIGAHVIRGYAKLRMLYFYISTCASFKCVFIDINSLVPPSI